MDEYDDDDQPKETTDTDNQDSDTDLAQQEDQAAGADEPEKDYYSEESDAISATGGRGGPAKSFKDRLSGAATKKVLVGGLGAGLATAFLAFGSFFGFLNVFKLEHIMQNLEARSFIRYQVSMSGRSDRWIRSYMMMRLSEIDGTIGPDGLNNRLLFRSDGVDTNRPLTDWYRTMRTSKFENDLLQKHGIAFTSVAEWDPDKKITRMKVAQLQLPEGSRTFDGRNLDIKDLNKISSQLDQFVDQEFDNNKSARRAIKNAVHKETRSWQVIKRRHLRKNIQNMLGVTNWRFFDKTRTRISNNVMSIRNRIIMKAIPDSTKAGKFIQCLFGIVSCRASRDAIDVENRTRSPTITGDADRSGDTQQTVDPETGELVDQEILPDNTTGDALGDATDRLSEEGGEELTMMGIKAGFMKAIISKLNVGTSILSFLDTLKRISNMFEGGSLIKMVTIARGTQAMALYTTYQIANDQLKAGEDISGEDINAFMQTVDSISNSESWATVINNPSQAVSAQGETPTFAAAQSREEYCSEAHQIAIENPVNHQAAEKEFHYLCGNKQIGGVNNAQKITDWWNHGIGVVINPIMDVYDNSGIDTVVGWFGSAVNWIMGPVVDAIMKIIPGLSGLVEDLVGWLGGQVASGLGAGPMMNGTEPSGVFMNMMVQGGAYTSESSARSQGAALTTDESRALAQKNVIAYYDEQSENQSVYDKYFSLDNPFSATSQGLFASIQNTTVNNIAGVFGQFVKSTAKLPFNIFSKPVGAATDNPYAAASFAGIETYDFPQQCYDLDPLTMSPQMVTNANAVLAANGMTTFTDAELTWDLVNNNTAFYDALYIKIREKMPDDADDLAIQIYNCAALDTAVRGGLGAVYGYDQDNGLEPGEPVDSSSVNLNIVYSDDTSDIPCAAGEDLGESDGYVKEELIKIRICRVQGITVNSQISGNLDALLTKAKAGGINLGGSGYRSHAKQIELYANYQACIARNGGDKSVCTQAAPPGKSRHESGMAIDFSAGGGAICFPKNSEWCKNYSTNTQHRNAFIWLESNAGGFGFKNLKSEAWHWSVDGH